MNSILYQNLFEGRGRVRLREIFILTFIFPPAKYLLTSCKHWLTINYEVIMEKKEFNEMIVKKELKTRVISLRISNRVYKKLEAKGIDIPDTIRKLLDRVAD